MANSFQKLADILNIETARLSGDPRRLQLASQMQEQKELKQATSQSEAEINKAIDESNLPESQKRLLKALSLKEKAALFLETQKPKDAKMVKAGDGYYYYTEGPQAGQRVLPGVVKPEKPKTMSEYVAEIMGKVAADPNYVLTKEDERVLQVSRKADPATMMIEDITAQAIREANIGGGSGQLPEYSSIADARAAGLGSGDSYMDPTTKQVYKIP
jgi:hypothetical protein